MKTVRNNQPFIFLLMAVVLLNCCQPDDSGHPCDEPTIQETRLLDKYDSLFPYNHTSKRLVYLYSNDTIENDTMIFELQDYVSWDIDTSVWDAKKCFIEYNEVQQLFYSSSNKYDIKLAILRNSSSVFVWETRNFSQSFNYTINKNSDFEVFGGVYYNDALTFGEILERHEVNGNEYRHVYNSLRGLKCDSLGSKLSYSPKFGFLEIYDACKNEKFTLIK